MLIAASFSYWVNATTSRLVIGNPRCQPKESEEQDVIDVIRSGRPGDSINHADWVSQGKRGIFANTHTYRRDAQSRLESFVRDEMDDRLHRAQVACTQSSIETWDACSNSRLRMDHGVVPRASEIPCSQMLAITVYIRKI